MTTTRPRLARANWTDAALTAMAAQGAVGVNVEQLARDLGTTKGSFYHHFESREALLDATLDRFIEIVETDLASATAVADPRVRLIEGATSAVGTAIDGFVDLALAASADNPAVGPALAHITDVRLMWLTSALVELGFAKAEATDRAEAGLATYLGLFHLQRVKGRRSDDGHLRRQIIRLVDVMCAPP